MSGPMAQICKIWTVPGWSTWSLRGLPRRKAPSSSFSCCTFHSGTGPTTAGSAAITLRRSAKFHLEQHRSLSFSRNTRSNTGSSVAVSSPAYQSPSACMSSTPLSFISKQLTRTAVSRVTHKKFVGVAHRNFFTSRIAMSGISPVDLQ